MIATLKLDEENVLEFDLEVQGTTESVSETRLVILNTPFSIMVPCEVAEGSVTAQIPKLKGIVTSGVYPIALEVIIDNRIFRPLQDEVTFAPLPEVASTVESVKPVEESVAMRVKNVTTKVAVPDLRTRLVKEGYNLVEHEGLTLIKSNNKYVGVLNRNKVLYAKHPHATLTALIDELVV